MMRRLTLGLLVVVLSLLPLPRSFRPLHASAAKQQEQPVILRINRNIEVAGYLALEDDDTITIRNLKGEIESFPKSRIGQIVRLVTPVPDQSGVVFLRDGQTREGIIVADTFEHVLIEIQGIRAKLKRETVSHVILQPTPEQRYSEYKASLTPGMYDAHLALCKWLVEQRRYVLAEQELTELLEQADMPEARRLLTLVQAQLALAQRPQKSPAAPSKNRGASESDPEEADSQWQPPDRILTKAEVNLMRVYEIDFDRPPKVTVPPEAVRAVIDGYSGNKQVPSSQTGRHALFRAAAQQPLEVVRLMFDLRARELYSHIQVNSEPYALNLFRERVHDTWLINNCATTACHGGPDAAGLFLHRKNYKDERVRYTNLLILERLELDPQWPLINYDRPEDSLIIQYALSREDPACRKPHPRVAGYHGGAIARLNHRLKEDAVEWIRSMMTPRPDYPVEFIPSRSDPKPALAGTELPSTERPER